jgi:hypothetical protein
VIVTDDALPRAGISSKIADSQGHRPRIGMTIVSLPLTVSEQKLVDASRDGLSANLHGEPDRRIRSEVFTALALGTNPAWTAPRGVRLESASVVGDIDLRGATVDKELALVGCDLPDRLLLEDSILRTVRLDKSTLVAFQAQRARFRGSLYLENLKCRGQLQLWDSRIEGSFSLRGASLSNPQALALDGGRMKVDGTVRLDRVQADGQILLASAEIRGPLVANDAVLINPEDFAFNGDNLKVDGSVFFRGVIAWGQIRLNYARLGSTLELRRAFVSNPSLFTAAINAFGVEVRGKVFLDEGFTCIGEVDFRAAKLAALLQIEKATLLHPQRSALDARGAEVRVATLLLQVLVRGQINFYDSSLGSFECLDSTFENPGEWALDASSLTVSGPTSLRNSVCRGRITFAAADLKGDLDLSGSRFSGPVTLSRARLGGSCNCARADFEGGAYRALEALGTSIAGTLQWRDLAKAPGSMVVLEGATVSQLDDDRDSWPHEMIVDGFTYASLSRQALRGRERLAWLRRAEFSPQAYEQAAQVLRRMGYERDARRILRAKQDDLRRRGQLGRTARIWNWLLGATLGHGYQVWRAALLLFALIAIGAIVFQAGYRGGHMPPAKADAKPADLPRFQAFAYSLDVGLPIIDLHQERHWFPRGRAAGDRVYLHYFWAHIALGWLFTSLLVTGLAGLVKKE